MSMRKISQNLCYHQVCVGLQKTHNHWRVNQEVGKESSVMEAISSKLDTTGYPAGCS